MQASDLIQLLSQALYVIVFLLSLVRAIRNPRPVTIEIAALFGSATVSVAFTWVALGLRLSPPRAVTDLNVALVMLLPYLLLRLVDEFAGVPTIIQRLAEAGLVAVLIADFSTPSP